MKIDTTAVLTMRGGEPFMRPGAGDKPEPLTLGWACIEALDHPSTRPDGQTVPLSKSDKIQRDKLATRLFEAEGEVEITAAEATLLADTVNAFLAHPRAASEAIRLIDPEAYARG